MKIATYNVNGVNGRREISDGWSHNGHAPVWIELQDEST